MITTEVVIKSVSIQWRRLTASAAVAISCKVTEEHAEVLCYYVFMCPYITKA